MKRIKLFTALLLAAAMVLPMAGCGKGKPKDGGEASPASCAAAGEYEVYSMTTAGTTLTRSQLEAGGMAEGMFLKINADGTGEINYTGSQTNAIKVDEKAGKVKIEGGAELDYALEGGRITLTFPGNSLIMIYESEAAEEEGKSKGDFASFGKKGEEQAAAPDSQPDMEFINDFLGDWHGMAEYYDCTGVYEANNRNQCEILARITYDEDAGELKPFVGAAFDGANQYNFKITSATEYQDDSYRYFKIGGRFMDQPLAEGSLVEYEAEYDRLWVIGIADDGEGNVLKMLGCLRRPGAKWDYENDYPYIDKDGVEFYKGKSLEEIAKLFKVDLNAQ